MNMINANIYEDYLSSFCCYCFSLKKKVKLVSVVEDCLVARYYAKNWATNSSFKVWILKHLASYIIIYFIHLLGSS